MTKLLVATVLLMALEPAPGSWSSGPSTAGRAQRGRRLHEVFESRRRDVCDRVRLRQSETCDQSLVEVFDGDRGDLARRCTRCRVALTTSQPLAVEEKCIRSADLRRKTTRPWRMPTSSILRQIAGRRLPRSRMRSARSPCAVLGDEIQPHRGPRRAQRANASRATIRRRTDTLRVPRSAVGRDHMGLVAYDGSLYAYRRSHRHAR